MPKRKRENKTTAKKLKKATKTVKTAKKRDLVAEVLWHENNQKDHHLYSFDYKKILVIAIPAIIVLIILALIINAHLKANQIAKENSELKTKVEETKKDTDEEMSALQKTITELQKKVFPEPEKPEDVKKGIVEGSLFFPGTSIPKDIKVCAENIENKRQFCTEQQIEDSKYKNGVGYKLELPEGKYRVFSTIPAWTGYQAFYSDFVLCGMENTCQSHSPIEVTVIAGKTTDGVDPNDWYNQKP